MLIVLIKSFNMQQRKEILPFFKESEIINKNNNFYTIIKKVYDLVVALTGDRSIMGKLIILFTPLKI